MQCAYERDEAGELKAVLPSRCPLGEDGSGCRVGLHHYRPRKTGPQIALMVARCHRHGAAFTVYPPGYVPYGRVAVAPVDLQGREVIATEPESPVAASGTIWEGTADAAAGLRWPETGGAMGSRRTQGRRLAMGAVLFGLHSEPRVRERVAEALKVAALPLHEAAQRYCALVSWRERAQVLLGLLARCVPRGLPRAVLAAGYLTGLWGRPSRWDPGGSHLRVLV